MCLGHLSPHSSCSDLACYDCQRLILLSLGPASAAFRSEYVVEEDFCIERDDAACSTPATGLLWWARRAAAVLSGVFGEPGPDSQEQGTQEQRDTLPAVTTSGRPCRRQTGVAFGHPLPEVCLRRQTASPLTAPRSRCCIHTNSLRSPLLVSIRWAVYS